MPYTWNTIGFPSLGFPEQFVPNYGYPGAINSGGTGGTGSTGGTVGFPIVVPNVDNGYRNFGVESLTYDAQCNAVQTYLLAGAGPNAQYNRYYTNVSYPYESSLTDGSFPENGFTYSIVAGILPAGVTMSSQLNQAIIRGTPQFYSLFADGITVTETSYPVHEPGTDRYYFVLKAVSNIDRTAFCETHCILEVEKDWCAIRDEFIKKISTQKFAINRGVVSNDEFLQYQKDQGIYRCPD